MHPMIERPVRLVAYLGVAAIFGGLLALLMQTIAPGSLRGALALCLRLALVYAFQGLSVWYPVRQLPANRGCLQTGCLCPSRQMLLPGAHSTWSGSTDRRCCE